jgi:CRISPR-associated protein Csd1
MILKALYDLAQAEHLVDDPDYVSADVAYCLSLGQGGKNPRLLPLATERQEGKKTRLDLPRITIAREPSRQGTKAPALFLVDKASYLFGLDPSGKAPLARTRQECMRFRERTLSLRALAPDHSTEQQALDALLAFLDTPETTRHEPLISEYESAKTNRDRQLLISKLIYVVYAPEGETPVHLLPAIKELWRKERAAEKQSGTVIRCLVTGAIGSKAERHTFLKGVPSATPGGVPLVSFNKNAFESYGLERNDNAPIGQDAAEAYSAALNRLLDNKPRSPDGENLQRQNLVLSSDTIAVFWSRAPRDFSWLLAMADTPDTVRSLLQTPHTGRRPALEDPSAFFTLILTGAQGRASVRSFLSTQTMDVARNVQKYLDDTSIVRPYTNEPGTYPLFRLLAALAALGDLKRLPPHLGVDVYLAALSGRPFPRAVLEAAVRRTRAEDLDGVPFAARCSLIRASLVRQRTFKEVPTVSLDPNNRQPAYLLGRVLAILDHVQQDALGSVNATLVDRYYGSASSTPAAVFPTLIRRSQHHFSKLRREKAGLAVVRERVLQESLADLHEFPRTLNLERQGLFALGFHHQRQAFFTKTKTESPETPTPSTP